VIVTRLQRRGRRWQLGSERSRRPSRREGRQVCDRRRLGLAGCGRGAHDHNHLVARAGNVDELEPAAADDLRLAHERERLASVVARAGWRQVVAMPFHVGVQDLTDRLQVAAQCGLEAAPGDLHVGLGHAPIIPLERGFLWIKR
jgi:hypothetical protein